MSRMWSRRLSCLALIALLSSAVSAVSEDDEPVVRVVALFSLTASSVQTTTDYNEIGIPLGDPDALIPGDKVYLEIWFQTTGPAGIASAVVDISYDTDLLDTSLQQVAIASQWMDRYVSVREVDETAGFINDVGGLNISGRGLEPEWAKIATIEFDVIATPATTLNACTVDGGPQRGFGMVGIGAVGPVYYGCACLQESNLDTLDTLVSCLDGPGETTGNGCSCADIDGNTSVDLADFAAFQTSFRSD